MMRQVDGRRLWIGNARDLRVPAAIFEAAIEAVVEVADSEPMATLPRELIRCRFPLSDGGDNSPTILRLAAETTARLVRARVRTLICCSAGMSRSICVAAAGIAIAEERSFAEAVMLVAQRGPADVSPELALRMRLALE
jgi:protein-tyrosine phosphatase